MINDFIEYWATAKLLLNGGNPYSPEALLESQKEVGWSQPEPLIMWNPPWTLSFTAPLGLLEYQTAQLLWFLVHALIIFIGAQLLWRIYGGSADKTRYPLLAALFFAPVYFVLLLGQIGGLVLLGLTAFLASAKRKQWVLAAVSLTLAGIKPHLVYLIWLALFMWVVQKRNWKFALFFVLAGIGVMAVPLFFDRRIYFDYLTLLNRPDIVRPLDWATPSLGAALAEFLHVPDAWIRWLPSAGGAMWFLWYWSRRAETWDWVAELPLLVIVSVTTSSFVWSFDQVVLLPAVIQAAVWVSQMQGKFDRLFLSGVFVTLGTLALACKLVVPDDFWYFWLAPAYLLCYLYARFRMRTQTGCGRELRKNGGS